MWGDVGRCGEMWRDHVDFKVVHRPRAPAALQVARVDDAVLAPHLAAREHPPTVEGDAAVHNVPATWHRVAGAMSSKGSELDRA